MWLNRKQGVCLDMGENVRTNPPTPVGGGLKGKGRGRRAEKPGNSAASKPGAAEPVGALVARRRAALKLTLQRVADMVGCAKSYLWLIERGRNAASEEILLRLQRALGFKNGELG